MPCEIAFPRSPFDFGFDCSADGQSATHKPSTSSTDSSFFLFILSQIFSSAAVLYSFCVNFCAGNDEKRLTLIVFIIQASKFTKAGDFWSYGERFEILFIGVKRIRAFLSKPRDFDETFGVGLSTFWGKLCCNFHRGYFVCFSFTIGTTMNTIVAVNLVEMFIRLLS